MPLTAHPLSTSLLLIHQKPEAKSIFITFFFSLASSLSLPFLSGVELLGEVFRQHSFYSAKKSKAAQLQFLKFSSSSSSFLGILFGFSPFAFWFSCLCSSRVCIFLSSSCVSRIWVATWLWICDGVSTKTFVK